MRNKIVKNEEMAGVYQLMVTVKPNAHRDAFLGMQDGRALIAIAKPPIEGKVNRRLVEFVAELAHLAPSSVQLVKGANSRFKTLCLPSRPSFLDAKNA